MIKELEELSIKPGIWKEEDEIPKQRVPYFIRVTMRSLLLPFILLDLIAEKIARLIIPPPYKRVGRCLRRGACCRFVLFQEPKGPLSKLALLWHQEINGFFPRKDKHFETDGEKILVMGCRYLTKEGNCSQYHLRPLVCRRWPVIEQFARPQLLKGCGYRAIEREDLKKKRESPFKILQ